MTHVKVGGSFRLTDHFGRAVTDEDYRGRLMMIFFGFTRCRKVCPETLQKLSMILDRLGETARQFAPLYITVDPERDDPITMRTFLEQRYPRFTGLTGSAAEIEQVKSAYRVFATRAQDDEDPHGYSVPHSALVFITDRSGRYLTHFNDGADPQCMHDRLLELAKAQN